MERIGRKRPEFGTPFVACIVGRVTQSRTYGRILSLLKKARYGMFELPPYGAVPWTDS